MKKPAVVSSDDVVVYGQPSRVVIMDYYMKPTDTGEWAVWRVSIDVHGDGQTEWVASFSNRELARQFIYPLRKDLPL